MDTAEESLYKKNPKTHTRDCENYGTVLKEKLLEKI